MTHTPAAVHITATVMINSAMIVSLLHFILDLLQYDGNDHQRCGARQQSQGYDCFGHDYLYLFLSVATTTMKRAANTAMTGGAAAMIASVMVFYPFFRRNTISMPDHTARPTVALPMMLAMHAAKMTCSRNAGLRMFDMKARICLYPFDEALEKPDAGPK